MDQPHALGEPMPDRWYQPLRMSTLTTLSVMRRGLEQASYAESVEALKKLKPNAERDNIEKLLHRAAISGQLFKGEVACLTSSKVA
jgi:hypothetical protein